MIPLQMKLNNCSLIHVCVSFVVNYMRFGNFSHYRAMNAQASALTHQSLRCSHTQSMDVDEGKNKPLIHRIRQHRCR